MANATFYDGCLQPVICLWLVPAIKKAMASPEVMAGINKIGASVVEYKSPAELKSMAIEEIEVVSAPARKMGPCK